MVRGWDACSLWCTLFFCSFVNRLVEFYPEIYDGDGVTSQYQANFGKKWRGYAAIHELANGDITKYKEIINTPLEECLLYLCYKSDKNMMETMMHKEAMKRSGS